LRPSHVCFICGTLPTGTLIVCIPNLFPPKENHNVGLLRFDDDHDHICYRFAQVRIFGGKSNVFKSLQGISESRKKNRGFRFKKTIDDVITRKQMTAWNFLWYLYCSSHYLCFLGYATYGAWLVAYRYLFFNKKKVYLCN
jgi:hypothetical protein